MNLTRFNQAKPYTAPGHHDMRMLRLQGHAAGLSTQLWLGASIILPGGGTTLEASKIEKIYLVLEGEVTIITPEQQEILGPWDSCRIAPGEARQLQNQSNRPATILLAMPLAELPANKAEAADQ